MRIEWRKRDWFWLAALIAVLVGCAATTEHLFSRMEKLRDALVKQGSVLSDVGNELDIEREQFAKELAEARKNQRPIDNAPGSSAKP